VLQLIARFEGDMDSVMTATLFGSAATAPSIVAIVRGALKAEKAAAKQSKKKANTSTKVTTKTAAPTDGEKGGAGSDFVMTSVLAFEKAFNRTAKGLRARLAKEEGGEADEAGECLSVNRFFSTNSL
jgi:hypothetical protein